MAATIQKAKVAKMNLFDHILTNHVFSDDHCDNSTEFLTKKTSSEEVSNNLTDDGRITAITMLTANVSIQRFVKTIPLQTVTARARSCSRTEAATTCWSAAPASSRWAVIGHWSTILTSDWSSSTCGS